ncbi:MAG: asparaginase domain-containing protein [Candidatus Micrarchaeota archaeon]
MENKRILILVTGGSIDDIDLTKRPKKPMTHIPEMLKRARITLDVRVETLMMKDSREITDLDRRYILERILEAKEDRIIITHGTFTMPMTAKYLGVRVKNKAIVLTGSAIPFSEKDSDALFNLGAAITRVQTLPKGIFITMNGEIFRWNEVHKNLEKDIFERTK